MFAGPGYVASLNHPALSEHYVSFCLMLSVYFSPTYKEHEKSLQMITGLVPNKLAGQILEAFSGHIISAASTATSFLIREEEDPTPKTSLSVVNCVVRKAQKAGWSLNKAVEDPAVTQGSCLGGFMGNACIQYSKSGNILIIIKK